MKFVNAGDVLRLGYEYFAWAEANPIWEVKPFAFQGEVTLEQVPHRRVWTLQGIRLYMGVDKTRWDFWRTDEHFCMAVRELEEAIYEQKFTGATSDIFNASIIGRDLGLVDKQERDHRSGDGSMTPTRITRVIVRPEDQKAPKDA